MFTALSLSLLLRCPATNIIAANLSMGFYVAPIPGMAFKVTTYDDDDYEDDVCNIRRVTMWYSSTFGSSQAKGEFYGFIPEI